MIDPPDLRFEYRLRAQGYRCIAGIDEAGRGAWAGPVVAGAVVLPTDRFDLARALDGVTDSKQLSPAEREAFVPRIMETARATGVGFATHEEIDTLGILAATRLAMRRALDAMNIAPDALLVDAVDLTEFGLPCTPLIRGDQRSLSIAAASILAKVVRDQFMDALDDQFPYYGFREHKGYDTELHRAALRQFGPCPAHRMTFAPLREATGTAQGAEQP